MASAVKNNTKTKENNQHDLYWHILLRIWGGLVVLFLGMWWPSLLCRYRLHYHFYVSKQMKSFFSKLKRDPTSFCFATFLKRPQTFWCWLTKNVDSDGKKFVVGRLKMQRKSRETICNFGDMTNFTPPGKSYWCNFSFIFAAPTLPINWILRHFPGMSETLKTIKSQINTCCVNISNFNLKKHFAEKKQDTHKRQQLGFDSMFSLPLSLSLVGF